MVLQERELFTLLLQKSMKMLDECSIVRRVRQTDGKENSFWRNALVINNFPAIFKLRN